MLTPEQKEIAQQIADTMFYEGKTLGGGLFEFAESFLAALPPAVPQPADDVVRNAERYMWLRASSERNGIWYGSGENFFHKDQLDAAIDAAMAKEKV